MPIKEHKFSDLAEFWRFISPDGDLIQIMGRTARPIFRGQGKASWPLEPSALRQAVIDQYNGSRSIYRQTDHVMFFEYELLSAYAHHCDEMGLAMIISESQMGAATALTSCGIAYVLKYIHAAVEAGVEMGIYPKDAQKMVAQSVKGAAELLLQNDTHPAIEIDKVTTPGGLTIKGLNELEHAGFSSAIIRAMKASR